MNDPNDNLRRTIGFFNRVEQPPAFQQIQSPPLAVQQVLSAQDEKAKSFKLSYNSEALKSSCESEPTH